LPDAIVRRRRLLDEIMRLARKGLSAEGGAAVRGCRRGRCTIRFAALGA
jgi:hypothetical protein